MKLSTLIAGLVLIFGSIGSMSAASLPTLSCAVSDTTAFSKAQCLNLGLKFLSQGTDELKADRYSDSVNSFEQSLYWMSRAGDRATAVLCLTQLCFIQEYCGDIAGALSRLDAADSLIDGTMEKEMLDVTRERLRIYGKHGMDDLIPELIARVDSLLRATESPLIRRSCRKLLADESERGGNPVRAKALYSEILGEFDSGVTRDTDYDEIYDTLRKLRALSIETKEYDDALKYSRRMLKMAELTLEVSDVGLEYFNIAEVYQKSGDTVRCLAASDSMSLCDRDMIMAARHLQLRAMMRGRFGKWGEAARLYEAADSALALCGEDTWPERMRVRSVLAGALYQSGDYAGGLRLYSERFDWCRKVYGESSDMTVQALCHLANMKAVAGDIEGGSRDYMDVERRLTSRIAERLRFLPGEARGACLSEMLDIAFRMSAFGLRAGHECDAFTESSWDALLMAKGLLLASERGASEIVRRDGTEEDRMLYSEISDLQRRLSELERVGCADASVLTETARQLAVADSRLAAQCASYGDVGAFLKENASAVRASLAKGDVILDMTDFNSSDGTHKYCAYIITPDSPYAKLAYLCNSSVPDALLEDGPAEVWRMTDSPAAMEFAAALADLLPKNRAQDGNVYVVPSGAFHLLPFESFTLTDGRLLGDAFNVVRLSSARDVVDICQGNSGSGAFGDAVSEAGKSGSGSKSCSESKSCSGSRPGRAGKFTAHRISAALFGGLDYGTGGQPPLPATSSEIRDISRTLGRRTSASIYSGHDGTAAAFRALNGNSPDIIHLVTHGFWYAPDASAAQNTYGSAMDRSGLVMSGGELLTASEIAALDLSGTSLVCLSACDTGQGQTTPEGIYGLQRAFRKSGVRYILMNLWESGDRASSLFMHEFYSALASGHCTVPEAFRRARTTLRTKFPEPFYWAGFILLN